MAPKNGITQRQNFFITVYSLNKQIEERRKTFDEELSKAFGTYMEENDESDRHTSAVKDDVKDVQKDVDALLATKNKNVCVRIVNKVPLLYFMTPVKRRIAVLSVIHLVEQEIQKTTNRRMQYEKEHGKFVTFAFRSDVFLRDLALVPRQYEEWKPEYELLPPSNPTVSWTVTFQYVKSEFLEWWEGKHVKATSKELEDWVDLKALCKCVVFLLDDTTSEYLNTVLSFQRLSNIAKESGRIATELVVLYAKYPKQASAISKLLGLITPVIYALWKVTEKAGKYSRDTAAIQDVVSDILSSAIDELEHMVQYLHELTTTSGSFLLANPYLDVAKQDQNTTDLSLRPTVYQLFNVEEVPEVARTLLESRLVGSDSELKDVCDNIQRIESEKAADMIINGSNSEHTGNDDIVDIDVNELDRLGLKKINLDPNPVCVLGQGSFSIVCKHRSENDEEMYAVKRNIKVSDAWNRVKREAFTWARLNHDNVLRLLGYWMHPRDSIPSLITLACPDGSVEVFLRNEPYLVEKKRLSFLYDVAKAMDYLHSEDIAHGDLRAANILIQRLPSKDTRAVLCDFGVAEILKGAEDKPYQSTSEQRTCDNWLAPELLFAKKDVIVRVSLEGDIFAFGCVILEIMFNKKPYAKIAADGVRSERLKGTPPASKADMDDKCWPIATRCWEYQKEDRPLSSWILSAVGNVLHKLDMS